MATKTDLFRRLGRFVLFVLVLIVGELLGSSAPAFSIANGPPSSVPHSEKLYSHGIKVSVTQDISGAGHFSWVILVSNTGPSVCPLTGYPEVDLLSSHGVSTKRPQRHLPDFR